MKILLVEDNPGDVVLAEEAFRATGSDVFDITVAASLADARAALAAGGVDLIILDLSLPDSSGLETFAAVKDAAGDVPIVIASGLDDERAAAGAVLAGAQDYLVKGKFTTLSLVLAVQRALGRHHHTLLRDVLAKMQGVLDATGDQLRTLRDITKDINDAE